MAGMTGGQKTNKPSSRPFAVLRNSAVSIGGGWLGEAGIEKREVRVHVPDSEALAAVRLGQVESNRIAASYADAVLRTSASMSPLDKYSAAALTAVKAQRAVYVRHPILPACVAFVFFALAFFEPVPDTEALAAVEIEHVEFDGFAPSYADARFGKRRLALAGSRSRFGGAAGRLTRCRLRAFDGFFLDVRESEDVDGFLENLLIEFFVVASRYEYAPFDVVVLRVLVEIQRGDERLIFVHIAFGVKVRQAAYLQRIKRVQPLPLVFGEFFPAIDQPHFYAGSVSVSQSLLELFINVDVRAYQPDFLSGLARCLFYFSRASLRSQEFRHARASLSRNGVILSHRRVPIQRGGGDLGASRKGAAPSPNPKAAER